MYQNINIDVQFDLNMRGCLYVRTYGTLFLAIIITKCTFLYQNKIFIWHMSKHEFRK